MTYLQYNLKGAQDKDQDKALCALEMGSLGS